MKFSATFATTAAAVGIALTAGVASAQSLTIALSAEPTSADPNYHKMTANDALASHIYSPLVARDAQMNLIPALALSWKTLDDTTWEFKLRPDVKFSNGKTFTSEDVLF
ncbi:MAG: ABC transporter substrate-binding protein, partial [Comamonadaceae bacterium]